jgi:2-hydroxy-3-oxopropionate reductase
MKLGFVGLGVMGTPMALNLVRGGHQVHLHSRTRIPEELLDQGGIACASATEAALRSEMVFTMLPDTPDVELVLFGERGFMQSPLHGKTLIDMSSISPSATRRFAEQLAELGASYLDALT